MRLELSTYLVPETYCRANPAHFNCDAARRPKVEVSLKHFFDEAGSEITIFLMVSNREDIRPEDPYEFDVELFGTFAIELSESENLDGLEDQYPALVTNGVRMLYSGARDYLHTITGKGPYGPLNLPSAYMSPKGIEFEKRKED